MQNLHFDQPKLWNNTRKHIKNECIKRLQNQQLVDAMFTEKKRLDDVLINKRQELDEYLIKNGIKNDKLREVSMLIKDNGWKLSTVGTVLTLLLIGYNRQTITNAFNEIKDCCKLKYYSCKRKINENIDLITTTLNKYVAFVDNKMSAVALYGTIKEKIKNAWSSVFNCVKDKTTQLYRKLKGLIKNNIIYRTYNKITNDVLVATDNIMSSLRGLAINYDVKAIETTDKFGRPVTAIRMTSTMITGELSESNARLLSAADNHVGTSNRLLPGKGKTLPKSVIYEVNTDSEVYSTDMSSEDEEKEREKPIDDTYNSYGLLHNQETVNWKMCGDHLVLRKDIGKRVFHDMPSNFNNSMIKMMREVYSSISYTDMNKLTKQEYFAAKYISNMFKKECKATNVADLEIFFVDKMLPEDMSDVDIAQLYKGSMLDTDFTQASIYGYDKTFCFNSIVSLLQLLNFNTFNNKYINNAVKIYSVVSTANSVRKILRKFYSFYIRLTTQNLPLRKPKHKCYYTNATIDDRKFKLKGMNLVNSHAFNLIGSNKFDVNFKSKWINREVYTGEVNSVGTIVEDGTITTFEGKDFATNMHLFKTGIKTLSPVDYVQLNDIKEAKSYVSKKDMVSKFVYMSRSDGTCFVAGKCLNDKKWLDKNGNIEARMLVFETTSSKLYGLSGSAILDDNGDLLGLLTGSLAPSSFMGTVLDMLDVPHNRLVMVKFGDVSVAFDLTITNSEHIGDVNSYSGAVKYNELLEDKQNDTLSKRIEKLNTIKSAILSARENKSKSIELLTNKEISKTSATAANTGSFISNALLEGNKYINLTKLAMKCKDLKVQNVGAAKVDLPFEMPGSYLLPAEFEEITDENEKKTFEKNRSLLSKEILVRGLTLGLTSLINGMSNKRKLRNSDVIIDVRGMALTSCHLLMMIIVFDKLLDVRKVTIVVDEEKLTIFEVYTDKTKELCEIMANYVIRCMMQCECLNDAISLEQLGNFESRFISNYTSSERDVSRIYIDRLNDLQNMKLRRCDLNLDTPDFFDFVKNAFKRAKFFFIKKLLVLPMAVESMACSLRDKMTELTNDMASKINNKFNTVLTPTKWFNASDELSASSVIIMPSSLMQHVGVAVIDYYLFTKNEVIKWKNSLSLVVVYIVRHMIPGYIQERHDVLLTIVSMLNGVNNLVKLAMACIKENKRLILQIVKKLNVVNKQRSGLFGRTNAFTAGFDSTALISMLAAADVIREIDSDLVRLSYADWIFKSDSIRNANKRAALNQDMLGEIFTGREKLYKSNSSLVTLILEKIIELKPGNALIILLGAIVNRLLAFATIGSVMFFLRRLYNNYMRLDMRAKAVEAMRDSFRKTVEDQKAKMNKLKSRTIVAVTTGIMVLASNSIKSQLVENVVLPIALALGIIEYSSMGTNNMFNWSSAALSYISGRPDLAVISLANLISENLPDDLYKSAVSVPAAVLLSNDTLGVKTLRDLVIRDNKTVEIKVFENDNEISGKLKLLENYAKTPGVDAILEPASKLGKIYGCNGSMKSLLDRKQTCIKFAKNNSEMDNVDEKFKAIIESPKFYEEEEDISKYRNIFYIGAIKLDEKKTEADSDVTTDLEAVAPSSFKAIEKMKIEDNNGILLKPTELELALGIRQRAQGDVAYIKRWNEFISYDKIIITKALQSISTYLRSKGIKSKMLSEHEKNILFSDLKSKSTSGVLTRMFTGISTMRALSAVLTNNNMNETEAMEVLQYMHNMFGKVEVVAKKHIVKQRYSTIKRVSRTKDDNRIRVIHAAEGFRRLYHRYANIWFNTCLILARFVVPMKIGLKMGFEWIAVVKSNKRFSASVDVSNFDANQHKGFDLTAMLVRNATGTDSHRTASEILLHAIEVSWRVSITTRGTVLVSTGTMASGDVNTSSDNSIRITNALIFAYLKQGIREEVRIYNQGDNAVIESNSIQALTSMVDGLGKVGLPTKLEGLVDRDNSLYLYTPEYLGTIGIKMTVEVIENCGRTSKLRVVAPWRATNRIMPKLVCLPTRMSEKNKFNLTKVKILCWLITWPLDWNMITAATMLNINNGEIVDNMKEIIKYMDNKRNESLKRSESAGTVERGWDYWAIKSLGLLGVAKRVVSTKLGWDERQDQKQLKSVSFFDQMYNEKDLHRSLRKEITNDNFRIATDCMCPEKIEFYNNNKDIIETGVNIDFCNNDYDNIIQCARKNREDNIIIGNCKSGNANNFEDCELLLSANDINW